MFASQEIIESDSGLQVTDTVCLREWCDSISQRPFDETIFFHIDESRSRAHVYRKYSQGLLKTIVTPISIDMYGDGASYLSFNSREATTLVAALRIYEYEQPAKLEIDYYRDNGKQMFKSLTGVNEESLYLSYETKDCERNIVIQSACVNDVGSFGTTIPSEYISCEQ